MDHWMQWRITLLIGVLTVAAAGTYYRLRPRPIDLREIKQTALNYRQQGNLAAFVAVLDQVPAGSPDKARAYFEQGRAYWELSRARATEEAMQKCLTLETNAKSPSEESLGAWGTLGDHYIGQERFDEAREVIWKAFDARARQGSHDAFYLILLLRLRFESAQPAVAIERLHQFLSSDPGDYDSHRALGIYLARIGELEESRQHLEFAVKAKPDVPRFVASWLWYLFHVNDIETVEDVLAQLPASYDQRAEFCLYRGKAADYRGDSNGAIAHYRRAVALEPQRIDANNLLAHALRKDGQRLEFDERITYCQRLGTAFRQLSDHYMALRDHEGANPDAATCQQISALCWELGGNREAQAWASLHESAR
jgi:tetratricopeptide (TPR) repeat protein